MILDPLVRPLRDAEASLLGARLRNHQISGAGALRSSNAGTCSRKRAGAQVPTPSVCVRPRTARIRAGGWNRSDPLAPEGARSVRAGRASSDRAVTCGVQNGFRWAFRPAAYLRIAPEGAGGRSASRRDLQPWMGNLTSKNAPRRANLSVNNRSSRCRREAMHGPCQLRKLGGKGVCGRSRWEIHFTTPPRRGPRGPGRTELTQPGLCRW